MQAKGSFLGVGAYLLFHVMLPATAGAHNAGAVLENKASVCEQRLYGSRPESWAGQTVILDTNVLFNDPTLIFKFTGAEILISGAMLEEVDGKKSDPKLGLAARELSRILDGLMRKADQDLNIKIDETTTLHFDFGDHTSVFGATSLDLKKPDNKILALAVKLKKERSSGIWMISDDINMRIKAVGHGLPATGSDAVSSRVRVETQDSKNHIDLKVTAEQLAQFRQTGWIGKPADLKIRPNQFVLLSTDGVEGSRETLARYFYDRENPERSGLRKLQDLPPEMAVKPRNMEQAMMLDLVLDPTLDLVITDGGAGTGKTTLAMAAGALMVNQKIYDRIIGTRTLVQIGKTELGAYKGSMDEKLANWFQNFSDAIEGLKAIDREAREERRVTRSEERAMTKRERREQRRQNEEAQRHAARTGTVPFEQMAFNHIRGRNLLRLLMILDETQNAAPAEVKTFNTRAGKGSKLILLGDATQIDAPYLNASNNGLSDAIARYTQNDDLSEEEQSRIGYVRLVQGERAPIVDITVKVYQ